MNSVLHVISMVVSLAPFLASAAQSGKAGLSKAEAEHRFKTIRNVRYDLTLDLTHKEVFRGEATLRFEHVAKKPASVRVDFREGTIDSIALNQKPLTRTAFSYAGESIELKGVPPGENRLDVKYTHAYAKGGDGLYRFTDPEDGRDYVYTNFEPYDANLAFPLFDQPDLKARYALKVTAPPAWIVTSATLPSQVQASGESKTWTFPEVGPFSTYVFSITAGDFAVWQDTRKGLPMRVLVRKSLARWVQPRDWFDAVKRGMDFYEAFFSTPYPYTKYDQVIVPDFTAGAMENVGNVTFNEKYVQRRSQTTKEKAGMYATILHELAHMWFGNLVTMKWWNGLWLNESFATFMAYLAIERFPELPNPWITFTGTTKQWAYWQDELVTTHPIEVTVNDTGEAFSNFDGITYGKGASVLRQLYYTLGDEGFRKGMGIYFKTYANQNTRIEDFLGALAQGSGKDLRAWGDRWLRTAQMNHVEAAYTCESGKIATAELRQTYPHGFATLRPHRALLALVVRGKASKFTVEETVPVTYEAANTPLPALRGKPCPAFLFPNAGDYDYVKVLLGESELVFLKEHLTDLQDDMLRAMLWQALWDSVEDGRMGLDDYLAVLRTHIPREKRDAILEDQQKQWMTQVPYYLAAKGRLDRMGDLADFFMTQWKAAKSGDMRHFYANLFVTYATRDDHRDALVAMLKRKKAHGLSIDQDQRWSMIHKLASLGDPRAQAIAEKESGVDRSNRGQENALVAKVLSPDEPTKRKYLAEVYDPKRRLSERIAIAKALLPITQQNLWPSLKTEIVETYRKNYKVEDPRLHRQFISDAFGRACDATTIHLSDAMNRWSSSETQKRAWAVRKQELERCARVIAKLP